jgi:Uma2 family endonuclease
MAAGGATSRRPATRADLETIPEHLVAEIIEGVLYTFPRPRARHANVGLMLGSDVQGPFQRGRGGPGGWWILIEPGIELPEAAEIVPDIAGWRRERMPELPDADPIRVAPDWVCEILSPGTRRHDQLVKKPFYARAGVRHLWIVDIEARTLTANRLAQSHWLEIAGFGEGDEIRAEPFEAVALSMDGWFPSVR